MNLKESSTKRVDELLVKINGRASFDQTLEIDQDVKLVVEGSVVKIEHFSNQDNSLNICYVIKPISVVKV